MKVIFNGMIMRLVNNNDLDLMEKHERLKSARQARRLSQEIVAKAGGIKQSQLSRMEKGQVWASNAVLKKLASFLGVPLSALLDINITQPAETSKRTDTPSMIAKNPDLPVGLRDLADSPDLVKQFAITPYEAS